MIRDPVPEVQFRDEEVETRIIVLNARHPRRNEGVMHSDSACSSPKLDFENVLHENGKRREHYMQLDPGDVNHCFMRSPYRCKVEHRL